MVEIMRQGFFSEQKTAMRYRLKLASVPGPVLWIATPAQAQSFAKGADRDGVAVPAIDALEGENQP